MDDRESRVGIWAQSGQAPVARNVTGCRRSRTALAEAEVASCLTHVRQPSVENQPAEHIEHMPIMTLRFRDAFVGSAQENLVCALHLTKQFGHNRLAIFVHGAKSFLILRCLA